MSTQTSTMAPPAVTRNAKRSRQLAILVGVTAVFVVLAGLALTQRSQELATKFSPQILFPGLAKRLDAVADVAIQAKTGNFHVHMIKGKGWVVPERNSFPANPDTVRATAAGVASLEAIEAKTARPDWLDLLGLGAPDKGGAATRIALSDADGKPMADLLAGNATDAGDSQGRIHLYVRRTGENQSWLASGSLTAKPEIGEWLDKNIMTIARDRIATTVVTPIDGAAFTLARTTKDEQNFKLLDLPKGRELAYAGSPDSLAAALVGFTFDDVQQASGMDFSKATQIVTRTFDGLIVTMRIIAKDNTHWATLAAETTGGAKPAEAQAINARTQGWAFRLPEQTAMALLASRDSLLKPLGGTHNADGQPDGPVPAGLPAGFGFPH